MAACYYDSAMAVIDQNYPGYDEIVSKSNGLAGLVKNLDLVTREDSLQQVAKMPEKERTAFIDKTKESIFVTTSRFSASPGLVGHRQSTRESDEFIE